MRRRSLSLSIVGVVILLSTLLLIIPGSYALAAVTHNAMPLVAPTPTPDASTTLQMAQQEETSIQTILNIINILVVVYPLIFAAVGGALAFFGVRGIRSIQKQGSDLVDEMKKLRQETEKEGRDLLNNIEREAKEKKIAIENTQTALVYLALGDRLSNQKDTRQAIAAYKKAGSLLPEDPQINYVLGKIYSALSYYDEAIKSFEAALKVKPEYPEAEMELGLAYRRRGEYRKGSDAEAMRAQDYEKAIEHLQRAVDLRPNYDDALSTLGGLYRRKKEYEKALEYYEQAYNADRSSSYALGNVASLAWYLGQLDKARKYYTLTELAATDRMEGMHAEVYWDYYDLALAQLVFGKTEEAKKNYQKAIGETPGVVQFDSVLNVLKFLREAKNQIAGLDGIIQMIENEKATRVSLG